MSNENAFNVVSAHILKSKVFSQKLDFFDFLNSVSEYLIFSIVSEISTVRVHGSNASS